MSKLEEAIEEAVEAIKEEWDDEGGVNIFKEVMSGFLSDMVEEVCEEL